MSLTTNAKDKVIPERQVEVTAPIDYSFKCVSDFVNSPKTQIKELQDLALGMASRIEELESKCESSHLGEFYHTNIHYPINRIQPKVLVVDTNPINNEIISIINKIGFDVEIVKPFNSDMLKIINTDFKIPIDRHPTKVINRHIKNSRFPLIPKGKGKYKKY